jgi:hypothetical protein
VMQRGVWHFLHMKHAHWPENGGMHHRILTDRTARGRSIEGNFYDELSARVREFSDFPAIYL